MTTHDFTTQSNFGNDPRRAAQLAAASKIDLDEIHWSVLDGPIGGHGFRKGTFTVTYRGQKIAFFSSIPHGADLDQQAKMVKLNAALAIAAQHAPPPMATRKTAGRGRWLPATGSR